MSEPTLLHRHQGVVDVAVASNAGVWSAGREGCLRFAGRDQEPVTVLNTGQSDDEAAAVHLLTLGEDGAVWFATPNGTVGTVKNDVRGNHPADHGQDFTHPFEEAITALAVDTERDRLALAGTDGGSNQVCLYELSSKRLLWTTETAKWPYSLDFSQTGALGIATWDGDVLVFEADETPDDFAGYGTGSYHGMPFFMARWWLHHLLLACADGNAQVWTPSTDTCRELELAIEHPSEVLTVAGHPERGVAAGDAIGRIGVWSGATLSTSATMLLEDEPEFENGAKPWFPAGIEYMDLPSPNGVSALCFAPDGTLYAGAAGGGVYRVS